MCIELKRFARIRTAREDISCYKVLKQTEYGLLSMSTSFYYEFGKTYYEDINYLKKTWGFSGRKGNEGFHSFQNMVDCFRERLPWKYVIVHCTIPKGSKYFKGTQEGVSQYISSAIIINEVLQLYKHLTTK